ncbi:PfkB family ribokinase [Bifidobacterium actinocoloniiforme DSM 22766]|uniref:Ribokinase n=1 Tax=Bifidobacterium actinocoloniiforme DSM 22766 TaxID=1437605 RepID=A0A086YZL6_9BIFI|nr:ribokinase [Bifidobacterium actinocoloniiforme]AKV56023.1 sugar kinase [Bifidobacterium actinocoloniiforme DSM 22766]KFI39716.1 PfkB family ribokinase [Bifidobacterium actinocoloniiforme DSM 22766]
MQGQELLEHKDFSGGSVVIFGSMNADYTVTTERLPAGGETVVGGPLTILPGGKSSNQAAAVARLGARAVMLGKLGTDANGDFLESQLVSAGVDMSSVVRWDGPSGATVITVDKHGENTIVLSAGANEHVDPAYVDSVQSQLAQGSVLGLCLESPMEAVTRAAEIAHQAGLTVVLNDSPFQGLLPAELIANVDLLLVNEHEMWQLIRHEGDQMPVLSGEGWWKRLDWAEIASRLKGVGFESVIVTLGSAGSMVLEDGSAEHVDAVSVKAVDTTGCGDSFMGAVLAGLATGSSLLDSAKMAAYVSAYAATGRGAQASYGNLEQVRAYFAQGGR